MSVAGGYNEAARRGRDAGCDCVQVFTTPPRMWPSKIRSRKGAAPRSAANKITTTQARSFQAAVTEHQLQATLTHASYLINLASPDDAIWQRSIDALVIEIQRSHQLGIPYVVFHPGAHTKSSVEAGLDRIVAGLNLVDQLTADVPMTMLLENTAGQGTNLGWQFEQLGYMLRGANTPQRFGVCLDTCHAYAAGYALAPRDQFEDTLQRFDQTVGLKNLKALHLNDSQKPLGSRVDRHAHIGCGQMGEQPFRWIVHCDQLRHLPMYIETEKGTDEETGEDLDAMNLRTLRRLSSE